MKRIEPNPADLAIWNGIFAEVPHEWRTAPPSQAMRTCARWLRAAGARTVLDVGCGVGRWTLWLHRQGFEVAGADFAPNAIAYARAWAADDELDISFTRAAVTDRPFPDRRFDAVVAALVLDLISREELDRALEIFRDTLVPGGHLFAVFNPLRTGEPSAQGTSAQGTPAQENPTAGITQISYSDEELLATLAGAGFELVSREGLDLETRGFLWRLAS